MLLNQKLLIPRDLTPFHQEELILKDEEELVNRGALTQEKYWLNINYWTIQLI